MNPPTALLQLLQQQTAVCRELVEALQRDRELVVRHDIPQLERSNERKEALVLQLQSLERQRQQETQALAGALGVPPAEARVSTLSPRLGVHGPALEATADNLRAVVASLRELVAISHGFLEQSILGIRGVLDLVASLRGPATQQAYDATGRMTAVAADACSFRREI